MQADIRIMTTGVMVSRPAAESGSQFYNTMQPLSKEGKSAAELKVAFDKIAKRCSQKECTKGDSDYLYSKYLVTVA